MKKRKETIPLINVSLIYSSNVDRLTLIDYLISVRHHLKAVSDGATREDYAELNDSYIIAYQPYKWLVWEIVLSQLVKFATQNKIENMKIRYKGEERRFFSTEVFPFEITDNENKTVYSLTIKGDKTYESQIKASN